MQLGSKLRLIFSVKVLNLLTINHYGNEKDVILHNIW